ncbi:LysR family transcriptional regulator [Dactylosporangium maewongense]|uniref:LysR family transcriptional regulator n=1 Tax=Dactylosporangium maewongense TaxID=634393 RepID=UPI0031CF10CE
MRKVRKIIERFGGGPLHSTESSALRYFREVAATGSVMRAGANLFVAPSAVSRQIRLLEEDLGVPLFTRGSRGMTLTAAGHHVLEFATHTQQRAADLRSELDADRHGVRGHVVIATVEGPLGRYIPDTLQALASTHPDIRIDVRVAGSHDVGAAVAEGTAHLGFVFGAPTRSDVITLKDQPLPLSVMVRPDHPLAGLPACSLRDVGDHPVALPGTRFGIRQEVDRACAETGTHLRISHEVDSLALLRDIAARTMTAIFMAAEDTAAELARGTLVRVPLTDRRLTRTRLTLVKGLQPYSSPAARTVGDALLAAMD